MLDNLKDPNTGQIKKPILISLIGGGGLLAFLLFSGKNGGVTATGLSSPLTPDLTGLQDALKGLASGGGGGAGSSPSLDPPPGFGTVTAPSYIDPSPSIIAADTTTPTPSVITTPTPNPIDSGDMPIVHVPPTYVDQPGDSGNSGGGGSGMNTVPTPIATSPDVYGGISIGALIGIGTPIARPPSTGPSRIYEPPYTPIPVAPPGIMVGPNGAPIIIRGMTIPTIPLPPRTPSPSTSGASIGLGIPITTAPRTSGGGTFGPTPVVNQSTGFVIKDSTSKPKAIVIKQARPISTPRAV